ncbi:hypothetical protein M9H77_01775 [Catharanthus roseus]|uniref:Uncharacterized protein n=1 Tax=Catharanthus roseus TaxID=4058 RepID=A0ACC0C702_CATRO|nr:hypothetical protein M9H77_01775 [Catharanthus roseus]
MRTSHGLSCSCELITWFDHILPIQLVDIEALWRTLEIDNFHIPLQEKDMYMYSKMRSLIDLLHQISSRPISKVREMHRLVKGVLNPILLEDPGMPLTSPLEVCVTKGRKKMNSTKRDKFSSGSGFSSGFGSGSSFGSGFCGNPTPCSTFPYIDAFPSFIYPFIENLKNVIGDGNCGYRVVANFVFGDERQ